MGVEEVLGGLGVKKLLGGKQSDPNAALLAQQKADDKRAKDERQLALDKEAQATRAVSSGESKRKAFVSSITDDEDAASRKKFLKPA